MRWLLAIVLLVFTFSLVASNNKGVIRGNVFDSRTNEPLPGTAVTYSIIKGVIANSAGYYLISVPAGEVTISYMFIGYKTANRTLQINANDTITLNVGLVEVLTEIDQIVISAGKVEQRLSELTVSLSIIEPNKLESNHLTNSKELLNKVSGVEVLDGQASIRSGSGFSYGAGSRVLTLVDGLPALSADAGNIRWQFLPLENISQIEIIKGASSVMYGSSALNGVINIRTADATEDTETKFYVETGVFGTPTQRSWKWWNTPRAFTSASFSRQVSLYNTQISIGSHLNFSNGYRKLNDEKLGRVNLKIKHQDSFYRGLSYGLKINAGIVQKTDFVLWEDAEQGALKQNESTAIEMNSSFFSFDPFISIKSTDRYSHDIRVRLQSTDNTFLLAENNNSYAFTIFSEYQTWYKLFRYLSINMGVSQAYNQIVSPFYGNHEGLTLAGFSQLNLNPAQRIKMVAGVRFENSSLNGVPDKIVPLFRAGANYRLFDFTFIRTSFGQGYRLPSIAEKHAATTLGAVQIFPNIYLEPEYGWNSEFGIKQAVKVNDINGLLDLAFFYSQNNNLIEYVFGIYPDGMGFRATNIEYSRVYGIELEFGLSKDVGKFSNSINGGYVYTYPVEFNPFTGLNTDIYLKFRRKHSGNISFNSKYGSYNFGLFAYARSKILNIDDVFLNPLTREDILPGFYDYWQHNNNGHIVFDLSFGYQLNKIFKLSLVIKNLANKEYMGRPGDIMPQRNLSIRVSGVF